MKAIVIKINDKVEIVEKVDELTPNEFVNYKKEAEQTHEEHKNEIAQWQDRVRVLENEVVLLKKELEKVWHQFKVDHCESED